MDAGLRFDEATTTSLKGKKMPAIALDLQSKTDTEIVQNAESVFNATDGVAKYAPAQATITLLGAAAATLKTDLTNQANAAAAAQAATATKDASRAALEGVFNALAGAFSAITPPLSQADILAANLSLRGAAAPVGAMPAVIDFLATMGDDTGEVDLTWSRVKGAYVYEVEYRLHVDGSTWTRLDNSPTESKVTVTGLVSGSVYAFRVRAVGAAGAGPWSDESVKMAA